MLFVSGWPLFMLANKLIQGGSPLAAMRVVASVVAWPKEGGGWNLRVELQILRVRVREHLGREQLGKG